MTTNLCVALVWSTLVTNPTPAIVQPYGAPWHVSEQVRGVPVEIDFQRTSNTFYTYSNICITIPGVTTNLCLHFDRVGTNVVQGTNVVPTFSSSIVIPTRTLR